MRQSEKVLFQFFKSGVHFEMRIGEEIQRREKEQRIAQIYIDISYYGKLKEPTEVTEYRYPPFDRGERD
jgi:uncharacterized protein (UPF0303 family)